MNKEEMKDEIIKIIKQEMKLHKTCCIHKYCTIEDNILYKIKEIKK